MESKNLDFKIDYKKMQVFADFNTENVKYPLILSMPHSGSYFPPEFLEQVNSSVEVMRHNEDIFVDELFQQATDAGVPTIKMLVSRSVIDLNRDRLELDPTMFYNYPKNKDILYDKHCRVGLGVIHRINYLREPLYKGLLDYKEVEARLKNLYDTYHNRLQQIIQKCLKKFGFCMVLDCHSMPSKICSIIDDRSGIDVCLGNLFSQSCPQDMSDFLAGQFWDKNYKVEFNCPYSGAFITFNYCQPRRKMYTLQLEINRVLYADENALKKNELFYQTSDDVCNAVINFAQYLSRGAEI